MTGTKPPGTKGKSTPLWPPSLDTSASPLYSLSGMYTALKMATTDEEDVATDITTFCAHAPAHKAEPHKRIDIQSAGLISLPELQHEASATPFLTALPPHQQAQNPEQQQSLQTHASTSSDASGPQRLGINASRQASNPIPGTLTRLSSLEKSQCASDAEGVQPPPSASAPGPVPALNLYPAQKSGGVSGRSSHNQQAGTLQSKRSGALKLAPLSVHTPQSPAESSPLMGRKQGHSKASQIEIQLVANAPAIPPSRRAVHPFFLAGTLLHGLPSVPSSAITGEKLRRKARGVALPEPPIGSSTAELVNGCVRPSLGPTRICYVQALACDAAEVSWCPQGHFSANLGVRPGSAAHDTALGPRLRVGNKSTSSHLHGSTAPVPSASSKPHEGTMIRIPTSAAITHDGDHLELMLPEDLQGRLAYGPVNYYVIHAWQQKWEDLVAAILQHYSRLPEVVKTGGTKFVPVYYWVDVFAVPQYERPCPEFKHHPERVLAGVMTAPSCQGVLLAAQPWSQPVTLTRAWCLYEVYLARTLCKELHVLLLEEQPGPEAHSPRLPLSRLSGAAVNTWAGQGQGVGRPPLAGDARVVQAIDSLLAGLDIASTSTRIRTDMDFIMGQVSGERGAAVGFNMTCRATLRPYILAAILSALLRSPEVQIWPSASAFIKAGAFLQWGSSTFVVDVNSPAGPADDAAAFLGLALRTCAPLGQPAAVNTPTAGRPSLTGNPCEGSNPIQELVFSPPLHPGAASQPTWPAHMADAGADTACAAGSRGVLVRTASGSTDGRARGVLTSSDASSGLPHVLLGTHRVQGSRPGSRCASPRQLFDSGIVSRSPRHTSKDTAQAPEDAIQRSLARMQSTFKETGKRPTLDGDTNPGKDNATPVAPASPPQLLTPIGLSALCPGLVGNTHLTSLTLSGHPIGCDGVHTLVEALSAKPAALRILRLNGCSIGPGAAQALGQLLKASRVCQLEELDLGNNPELAQGVMALASGLATTHCLKRLYLGSCSAGSEAVAVLARAMLDQLATTPSKCHDVRHHGLEVLDLRDNQIDPEAAEAIAPVLSHPACSLRELMLSHNMIETRGALAIAKALQVNRSLQTLQLRDNQLALEVGAALGIALSGELPLGVRPASPSRPTIGPIPWPAGAQPSVQGDGSDSDSLSDSGLTPPRRLHASAPRASQTDSWGVHAHASPCRLQHVDLGGNPLLGDVGVELLAQGLALSRGKTQLAELLLDDTNCGPGAAAALAKALSSGEAPSAPRSSSRRPLQAEPSTELSKVASVLQLLDLSNNPLLNTGAVALASLIPVAGRLETLRLQNCKIGASGRLALLAALQLTAHSAVRLLDLAGNGMDPAEYVPPPLHSGTTPPAVALQSKRPQPAPAPSGNGWLASAAQYSNADGSLLQVQHGINQPSRAIQGSSAGTTGPHASPHPSPAGASAPSRRPSLEAEDEELLSTHTGAGLSKLEAVLAQSLTIARQLQSARAGMVIKFA